MKKIRNYKKSQFMQRCRREISNNIIYPYSVLKYKLLYKKIADRDKIIYVDTDDILAWYRGNRYSDYTFEGQIKGGDWSNKISTRQEVLSGSHKYKGIVQHFVDGKPWIETDLFKIKYNKLLEKGIKQHGFDNLSDLEIYYINKYDNLYENIKNEGILSEKYNKGILPIYVNINYTGQILYTTDGNHRFFMCLILGIKRIGVKVWMRHNDWQRKRDRILCGYPDNIHPDDIPLLSHPDIVTELQK